MESARKHKSIGITSKEKGALARRKELYEQKIGGQVDWGQFLSAISVLGLTALGVYKLAKASKGKSIITCPECSEEFALANIDELPAVIYTTCPHCSNEISVEFEAP